MEHDGCKGCKYDKYPVGSYVCKGCVCNSVDKYTPQNNGDKIRDMDDADLAEFLCNHKFQGLKDCYDWLKQFAKE